MQPQQPQQLKNKKHTGTGKGRYNQTKYNSKLKCPVKLTGVIGTNNVHPFGEGFLHLPAPTPSGFL